MQQTVFEIESLSFVQKAVECSGDCVMYDLRRGIQHRHCAALLGDDRTIPCNAFVLVESDGPSSSEIAVDVEHGMICPKCERVVCKHCISTRTPTSGRLCLNCSDAAWDEVDSDPMMSSLLCALAALNAYHSLLARETNAVKIKETLFDLHRVEDELAAIKDDLKPNIERAYASGSAA